MDECKESQSATPAQNGGFLKSNIFTLTIPQVNILLEEDEKFWFIYLFSLVVFMFFNVVGF